MTVQELRQGLLDMGKAVISFEDHGTFLRVYADIPARRNGLPNTAAMQAAMNALDAINPDAFDPIEGVSEDVARARLRDRIEHIETSAESPPVPVYDDEIPGYRCANGACTGD